MNTTITFGPERRPAIARILDKENAVNGAFSIVERRCLVHSGAEHGSRFIVEFEDGTVESIGASRIRFIDSDQQFGEYAWE